MALCLSAKLAAVFLLLEFVDQSWRDFTKTPLWDTANGIFHWHLCEWIADLYRHDSWKHTANLLQNKVVGEERYWVILYAWIQIFVVSFWSDAPRITGQLTNTLNKKLIISGQETVSPSLLLPLPEDEIKSCCLLIIPHDNYVGVVAKPYCYSKNVLSFIKPGLKINEWTFPSLWKKGVKCLIRKHTQRLGGIFLQSLVLQTKEVQKVRITG